MMMSSGLVFLMVPAMSLFYSGATSRQSSLKLFRLPLITAAVVGFQVGLLLLFNPGPVNARIDVCPVVSVGLLLGLYTSSASQSIAWAKLVRMGFPWSCPTR
jgi:ammonia channel protein AmtB